MDKWRQQYAAVESVGAVMVQRAHEYITDECSTSPVCTTNSRKCVSDARSKGPVSWQTASWEQPCCW